MTTFNERERAFEAKFAHDADMQFRVEARRNRLLGLWAAALLGKADPEAYVAEVVQADFIEAGSDDVLRKVTADLAGKVSAEDVRATMEACFQQAKTQLIGES